MINGENLERHRISGIHDYSNYGYHGFPNIRQLLILNWRLCRVNIRDFVETYIATECSTPEKWQEWRKLFIKKPAFRDILAFEDFSLCLQADRLSGAHFIGSIVEYIQHGEKLPAFGTKKIMRDLHAKYLEFRVEQINPITEALFMVMRGHNAELLNREHPNLPACAEGAYLGMLRALEELLPGEKAYRAVVLDGCA